MRTGIWRGAGDGVVDANVSLIYSVVAGSNEVVCVGYFSTPVQPALSILRQRPSVASDLLSTEKSSRRRPPHFRIRPSVP
jgi:hypothetical protein